MTTNPELIGRHYRLIRKIGEGSFGEVWRVFDTRLRKERVVKIMKVNASWSPAAVAKNIERFEREARAMAKMEHPNIVTVHAVDEENGQPFMVMQLVKGLSVEDILAAIGPLGEHEALRIAIEAAKGIAEAHANGLVHRDIKPANILIEQRTRRVLVTDFGIAIDEEEERMTRAGSGMGTKGFWAPEQRDDSKLPVDARSDVYGHGCTLYRMLTGNVPSDDFFMRVDALEEDTLAGIHPEIVGIIKRSVKWHPDERYQSMDAMREAMEEVMRILPESEPMPFPDIPWLEKDAVSNGKLNSNPTAAPVTTNPELQELRGTSLPPLPRPITKYIVGMTALVVVSVGGWLVLNREHPVDTVASEPVVEQSAETLTTGAAVTSPKPTIEPAPAIKAEPVVATKPMAATSTKADKPKSKPPTSIVTTSTKPVETETVVEVQKPVTPSVGTPTSTITNGRLKIDVTVSGMTDAVVTARYRAEPGANWLQKSMSPQGDVYRVEIAMTGELANGVAFFIEAAGQEGKKRSGSVVAPFVVRPQ